MKFTIKNGCKEGQSEQNGCKPTGTEEQAEWQEADKEMETW